MSRRQPRAWWRVRGRSVDGNGIAYLTVGTLGDRVIVCSPGGQPVVFSARRVQRLRLVLGWAMAEVLRGVFW